MSAVNKAAEDFTDMNNDKIHPNEGELIEKIKILSDKSDPVVISIDGHSASGKTTLAGRLAELLNAEGLTAGVVHMDDFFLPPQLRTGERLSEPGGNVHYERFSEEIFVPLSSLKENKNSKSSPLIYHKFDCGTMSYSDDPAVIPLSRVYIIEGAYSQRPEFISLYDLKIFMDITESEQRERILARNGAEGYKNFREKWIPMENRYFERFRIKENSDIVFYTSHTM